LGEIKVPEQAIYSFPTGLPGFPSAHRFAFVRHQEYLPFIWMVALDEPDLAFVVVGPDAFFPNYNPRLSPEDADALGLSNQVHALLYCIVTIPGGPREATVNLRAPVALNTSRHLGRQAILAGQDYHTREPLFGARPQNDSTIDAGRPGEENASQGRRELIAGSDAKTQPEHHHR
jgi:flagellar assembly factor FliW